MTKAKKYRVLKNIHRNEVYRFWPGDVVVAKDIKDAPIKQWLEIGVLEVVEDA